MRSIIITAKTEEGSIAIQYVYTKYNKFLYRQILKRAKIKMLISLNEPRELIIEFYKKEFDYLDQLPPKGKEKFERLLEESNKNIQTELQQYGARFNKDYEVEFR